MNGVDTVLTIGIIVIIAAAGWISAFNDHKRVSAASPEAIQLPRVIGILFGGLWIGDTFHFRGIMLQILVYVLAPALTFQVLEIIPQYIISRCIISTITVFAVVAIVHALWKKL